MTHKLLDERRIPLSVMKQLPSMTSIKHQYPISSIEKAISLQIKPMREKI